MRHRPLLALAISLLIPPSMAGTQQVIDLHGVSNAATSSNHPTRGVSVSLEPGAYEVRPFAGVHEAWSAWSHTGPCDADGTGCQYGWLNGYKIASESVSLFATSGDVYETANLALSAAEPAFFTLRSAETVYFYLSDNQPDDNRGGMSLRLPEPRGPSSFLCSLAALVWLASGRRRAGGR